MVKFGIKADKAALLIIDMQHAFLAPGSPSERPLGRDLIPKLNRLIRARHENGIMVVLTRHAFRENGSDMELYKDFLSPAALEALTAGTNNVDLHPAMEQQKEV